MRYLSRLWIVTTLFAVACSSGIRNSSLPSTPRAATYTTHRAAHRGPSSPAGIIKHVVIIVQEDRSFDNLFADFPSYNPHKALDLAPRNAMLVSGCTGNMYTYSREKLYEEHYLETTHLAWTIQYNWGGTPCFDQAPTTKKGVTAGALPYHFVAAENVHAYYAMADTYALNDEFFQANSGASFPAHQYLIAAQSELIDEDPELYETGGDPQIGPDRFQPIRIGKRWGCDSQGAHTLVDYLVTPTPAPTSTAVDATGYYPCYGSLIPGISPKGGATPIPVTGAPYLTLAQEIDAAPPLTWAYYSAPEPPPAAQFGNGYIWNAYDAVPQIRQLNGSGPGQDWTNNIKDTCNLLADLSGSNPTLANVTWVTPYVYFSDHPDITRNTQGPAFVSAVVNAIGTSPFWKDTAIFVLWDDWGGFYDHVNPNYVTQDMMGWGFRVPLIAVSPYVKTVELGRRRKTGYVSTTPRSFGSILKFTEEAFGLPSLTSFDGNADAFDDMFDYAGPAHFPFVPIPAPTFRACGRSTKSRVLR